MLSDPARIKAPLRDRIIRTVTAVGAVCAALLSAWLIDKALGEQTVTLVFGALLFAVIAIVFTFIRAQDSARLKESSLHWGPARIVIDRLSYPAALTDHNGALIMANDAWALAAGGYFAPREVFAEDQPVLDALERACRASDNGSAIETVDVKWPVAQQVQPLLVHGLDNSITKGCRLWSIGDTKESKAASDARGLITDEVGLWLSTVGVSAVLTDVNGRILAANESFALAVGDDTLRDKAVKLTKLLDRDERGGFSLITRHGEKRAIKLSEFELGEQGNYLFLLSTEPSGWPSYQDSMTEADGSIPALLGTLPLGLAIADREGRFRFINQAFVRAAGLTSDNEILYPSDLVVDDEKAMVADIVRKVAVGKPALRDLRVRLKNAPDKTAVITLASVTGMGQPAAILYLADNSEQEKLERQVAQATKMQAVGQLAGGVAHDFNNILTAIIGLCDLMLLRHGPGDSDFDDITQIKQNANRAANLVRQLLAFSRQQTLRPQVLQLSDVVGELSHLLKRLLGEQVNFSVKHGRNLGPVRADPGQLEQVIVNLAVNARDAMPSGGELTISTHSASAADIRRSGSDIIIPADYTVLRISDTGQGIPADVLSNIFEPFFTTKEVGKGTGLGLSTVYGIVKQTGGYIFAESPAGKGATFTIYLPVYQHGLADGDKGRVTPIQKPQANELWGVGTILLVEDEATVRAVAERALVRKGYRVVTAANGIEALEQLAIEDQIDLLISDVVMPEMDGPTFVKQARETRPDIPVVFMSGYAEEQLRKTISVPNFAFLPKPFSVSQLGEVVREALNSPTK